MARLAQRYPHFDYSPRVLHAATLLVHLVSFAAYIGAGFAQQRLMKLAAASGTLPSVRDSFERLAATVLTRIELPAVYGSIVSGIVFVTQSPALMKQGWLHGKLTCVLLLAALSHLEMFNARAIVKLRAGADGAEVDVEIAARMKSHALLGAIGTTLVVILLAFVTFVRLGAFATG